MKFKFKEIKLFLAALLFRGVISQDNSDEVEYYTNLIGEELQRANTYPLPTDASAYKPDDNKLKVYGHYDFVIIGAGSSGAVIANRLSENPKEEILLVEAGGPETNFSNIPAMALFLQGLEFNWNYNSTPQTTACLGMLNNECPYPRGKSLGGSSAINGLVYARGNKKDYNDWAELGNPGWSYNDVLPFFKKSENCHINNLDPGYHGKNGYLSVDYRYPDSPQANAFLEANQELGYKILDYNGRKQLGAAKIQANQIHGRRDSTGRAFLKTAQGRHNLKISINSYVTKILIEEQTKTAYGVIFSKNKQLYVAFARKEVILSAGSIASPQLLMLSGIGPKAELQKNRIKPITFLPVGETFVDHPTYQALNVITNYTEVPKPLPEYVQEYLNGVGPFTFPANLQGLGFYQSTYENASDYPDLEIIIIPSNNSVDFLQKAYHYDQDVFDITFASMDPTKSFTFYIILLHPVSSGDLKLKSGSPYDYPLINPKFLSDEGDVDIDRIYEGIQLALKLLDTEAFRKINATLQHAPLPPCMGLEYLSKEFWYCQIRQLSFHAFHPISTCKMGPDPRKAVVNAKLKVHGIKKLRVADCSVIPKTTSGHTNAAAIMIGEKAADMIKKEYGI